MAERRRSDTPTVEVSSGQLHDELIEIKERVGALENVAGIVNSDAILKHIEESIKGSQKKRQLMRLCEEPKTRPELAAGIGANSRQALDHHLNPLREDSLIHVKTDEEGLQTFQCSNLTRRANRGKLRTLLDG